ncbi:hypothetical protein [Burkholderia sp. Nafp2/4-1b]|uniref:hypothetical protein n=1 Tax=Burkholderia sp. Nafp2/4-1b TaxID=2116686 RepID=UPI0013CF39FF|nr:hypothetical protein [Burkholderia sp. Nafp2/4-1b]
MENNGAEPRDVLGFMIEIYRVNPALLVLHLAGALIAWFAPDDALTRWPYLRIVVKGIGEIFPLVFNAIKESEFPDITALYFALMLIAVPLRFWVAIRICCSYRDRVVNQYSKFSFARKIYSVTVVFAFAGMGLFSLFIAGYYFEWNFVAVSRSRLWLGFIGPLFAGGADITAIAVGSVVIFITLRNKFTRKEE